MSFDVDGTFSGPETGDRMSKVQVQVKKRQDVGSWDRRLLNEVRETTVSVVDDQWHIPGIDLDKSRLRRGVRYDIRAKVWDRAGKPSAWTSDTFTILTSIPTVSLTASPESDTPAGMILGGGVTPDPNVELTKVHVTVTDASGTVVWRYSYPASIVERQDKVVAFEYGGPDLGPGVYTYRVIVEDSVGGMSSEATGTFTLTVGHYVEEPTSFTTGYSNDVPSQRLVLYGMDPRNRGPRNVVGIIEDASNIGLSWYATAPGELYFTLPVTHPQVSVCEPLVTHYKYEQYRRGQWKELSAGILRDFDAKENDAVFYGLDYLGLLSKSIEAARQPTKNPRKNIGKKADTTTGSRYFNKTIKHIIRDQLHRARAQDSNSPVSFIQTGRIDDFSTRVTIYASFAERLSFIRGLIDSHKGAITDGGGERRSRLRVRWDPAGDNGRGQYEFEALDGVGTDRDNMRLEYGSLIQGYQVIALEDWANIVYGIGKEPNHFRPHFSKQAAPGVSQQDWGSHGKAAFWPDVTDAQDLKRRTRAEAIRGSRVGKRIALGLRVQGVSLFDGWDLLDNVPLVIDDGVVDTGNYGSGYWTIWGCEYRLFPDGHDEVTLVLRPKGDGAAIDANLIDSDPIHMQAEWKFGQGAPS